MSLPPGATLVSGSVPTDASQLPPGATLVSGSLPSPTQGAVSRFNESLSTGLGAKPGFMDTLSEMGSGLKEMVTHPITSASLLLHGAADSQQQVIDKAYEEQHSPDLLTKAKGYVRGAEAAIPVVGPMLSQAGDQFSKGDIAGGLGTTAAIAAPIVTGEVGPKVPELLQKAASSVGNAPRALAESAVGPLVRKPLAATMEDTRFNRSPVKAIIDEGLSGSKPIMVQQATKRIGELSNTLDAQLQSHPNANVQIDAAPIIDKAIGDAVQGAKKAGNKAAINRLNDLSDALKTQYGPTSGTPFEINNLKRQVGDVAHDLGAFKSTDPLESSAAAAMGDVYTGLKKAVNEQVPEVAPINERISNLMSAKTGLTRNIALEQNKSFLSGMSMTNAPFKLVEKAIGSAPVRSLTGKALATGTRLEMPKLVGGPADFNAPKAPESNFVYRVRSQGEEGVPIGGSNDFAHATATLEDAKKIMPGRESMTGEPQEIVKIDTSKLKPEHFQELKRLNAPSWYKFHQPVPESALEIVQ